MSALLTDPPPTPAPTRAPSARTRPVATDADDLGRRTAHHVLSGTDQRTRGIGRHRRRRHQNEHNTPNASAFNPPPKNPRPVPGRYRMPRHPAETHATRSARNRRRYAPPRRQTRKPIGGDGGDCRSISPASRSTIAESAPNAAREISNACSPRAAGAAPPSPRSTTPTRRAQLIRRVRQTDTDHRPVASTVTATSRRGDVAVARTASMSACTCCACAARTCASATCCSIRAMAASASREEKRSVTRVMVVALPSVGGKM